MTTRVGIWPPLAFAPPGRRPEASPPFPLGEEGNVALFARARHGVWQGVQALGLLPGDCILAPAYHHGSEIEALIRAGLSVRFYGGDETLQPTEPELERLLDDRVRALYLVHYLGFPQDGARWRRWCDEHGLLLLEDAAQAWLTTSGGRPVGATGDLAVFCLYKTIGVPDGAALYVRAAAPGPELQPPLGVGPLARRHAVGLAARSASAAALMERLQRRRSYDAVEDFALGDPATPPSAATAFLLGQIDVGGVASRRRANASVLLGELNGHVPPPFDYLPPGASPFGIPIETDRKDVALERLARRGVAAFDFWSAPHPSLPQDRFRDAVRRRSRTILLPVHQELGPDDLERIADGAAVPRRRVRSFRLEHRPSFDSLRYEWNDLAAATGNVFATWEWARTWWRHFGGGRTHHVTACRAADGRLLAILPLYVSSVRPLRVVRFIGHGPADQLGPICRAEDRAAAATCLRRVLAELRPDVFLGEHLPRDEGWGALLGGRMLRAEGSPVLALDASSWDDFLATRSANVRQQARRLERKLDRDHGLRYRGGDSNGRLESDLDALFALHSARWGASAYAGRHARFHRDFAALARDRGWLRLWFLEADGRTVAAWHGFRFAGVESYYQAGRDPSWEGPAVGSVLLAHSIRSALEDGMREYRFLRGDEQFKYRFASHDPGLETIGIARGAVGDAALAAGKFLPEPFVVPLRRKLVG
jgi:CelD/BcsL family acetyltransferase involved in cellulose biosynthesis